MSLVDKAQQAAYMKKWHEKHPGHRAIYNKKYQETNKDKLNASARQRYKDNPSKAKDIRLRYNYGLSKEQYDILFESQGHRCAICGTWDGKEALAVDHCHKIGRIRGLLCRKCNLALGYTNDDTAILQKAIDYLKRGV